MVKLSKKQELFVEYYCKTLNATKSAEMAGYSKKTAYIIGHENLRKPKISSLIEKEFKKHQKKVQVDKDFIVNKLLKIANTNIKEMIKVDKHGRIKLDDNADGELIQSISQSEKGLNIRTKDGLKALELLGKHLGIFTDRVDISGNVPVKIIINEKPKEEEDGKDK